MTGTAISALPTSGDSSQWTPSEAALVEAAGLTTGNGPQKKLAPRPVVEAFLLHARRTGLDPIARQIYCIERGGRWGTQVSIDGARLVAERTGQYRGQTPTQWTDDGEKWVDVWLKSTPPAAARVGVFREGFNEPLFAVATFDAYNAGGNMWKKMPALMLGKCAEMLALRKAFPQDLSGLYSTEEMDQAGAPRAVVAAAEKHAEPIAYEQVREPAQTEIAPPALTLDWVKLASEATTVAELTGLANRADQLGEIGIKVDDERGSVIDVLRARRAELEAAAAVTPPMVDVPASRPAKRQWAREARGKKSRAEVRALVQEMIAAGALVQLIEEVEAIERTLPDEEATAPTEGGSWPVVQIPVEKEWIENEDGSFSEAPTDEFPGGDAA